jgi:hypothetical protein
MQKMLRPERRLGVRTIPVTTVDSWVTIGGTKRRVRIPAGTPVDYVARVDPTRLPDIVRNTTILNLISGDKLFGRMPATTKRPTSSSTRATPSGPRCRTPTSGRSSNI